MTDSSKTPKTLKALETLLHRDIPLTQSMGLQVMEATADSLRLRAPLQNNINHKSTAFGGSLYASAVLTGWGLIHLALTEHDLHGHIVIQESHTRFLKPVKTDIETHCRFESEPQLANFLKMYRRKGRARIQLTTKIYNEAQELATVFEGQYVVHR